MCACGNGRDESIFEKQKCVVRVKALREGESVCESGCRKQSVSGGREEKRVSLK